MDPTTETVLKERFEALTWARVGDLVLICTLPKEDESDDDSVESDERSEGDAEEEASNDDEHTHATSDDPTSEHEVESQHEAEAVSESLSDAFPHMSTYSLYRIDEITDDGKIFEVKVCPLKFCLKPCEVEVPSYHIHGLTITQTTPATEFTDGSVVEHVQDLADLLDDEDIDYGVQTNPSGDSLRHVMFRGQCPARCNGGWIATQEEMHALLSEDIVPVAPYQPVCPVCVGKDLTLEHQQLRETLQTFYQVDFGMLVEFYGRLNDRRRNFLRLPFYQLDEREWGMLFDDMISEDDDESEGDGRDHDGWGYYAEALDPNSNPVTRPAEDSAIEALPRKLFSEVSGKASTSDNTECLVCGDKFREEAIVVEMPCSHIFCDGGCIAQWLKQYNNCPVCRFALPSEDKDKQVQDQVDSIQADSPNELSSDEAKSLQGEATSEAGMGEVQEDGEDVVMNMVAA